MNRPSSSEKRTFQFIMIKPSHYDDDGYVIQWFRSMIPSNSMAAVYGIAKDCADRKVLGENVEFRIRAFDETNTRIKIRRIVRMIESADAGGLVALVGVQTNQFPRAMDIARKLREHGVPVCIGGFHVSGCLSMLPEIPDDLQEAMDLGISLFAGELEGRFDLLLKDVVRGEMQPLYNHINDLPSISGTPTPFLPATVVQGYTSSRTSFDAGRGCPFQCSFCTIINVQGRKSRYRTPEDVERVIRANARQGVNNYFITDDNFARNKEWEAVLDTLIRMREEEGFKIRLIIQVDTLAHKIKRFIEKAGRAGVDRVFIGLENINPESLEGAMKKQNKIGDYREMLQAWHSVGAVTLAGYILGFPADSRESILRDIKIIQRELPIDILEFFILTPLPGSADHRSLYDKGVDMDPDMNNYDLFHATTDHQKMSREELKAVYEEAWNAYYSLEHLETVLRRAKQWNFSPRNMAPRLMNFHYTSTVEKVHPLEGGLLRRKYRHDRRSGMPVENPFVFYPRYLAETVGKLSSYFRMLLKYEMIIRRVEREGSEVVVVDPAMEPARGKEEEEMALAAAEV